MRRLRSASVWEKRSMSNTPQKHERPRAYTVRETQQILRVSRATLYCMFREGRIASIKIGNCRRVTDEAIDAVLGGGA